MTALDRPIDLPEVNRVQRDSEKLSYIRRKVRDAQIERSKHEQQWKDNLKLSMGAHADVFRAPRDQHFTEADRISHVIVTQYSVQTEEAPQIVYAPRETNEPPDWFLKPSGAEKVAQLGGHGLSDAQLGGEESIDDEVVKRLLEQQVQTGAIDEMGQPMMEPLLSEAEDFIAVTDQVAADALTQEVASQWDLSHCDEFVRSNIFDNIVIGHSDVLFEWVSDEYRGKLVDLYPYNVWIDRWSRTNGDGEYYVIRQVMPLSEARREFPHIPAEVLDQMTTEPNDNGYWGGMVGGRYQNTHERQVVELWTLYERNVPYERDEDEAVDMGIVEPLIEQVPVEQQDEFGQVMVAFEQQQAQDEEGAPVYTLTETGEQTTPGAENWPKRYGCRQLQMLHDIEIFDGECELTDIPIARNRNIPIVHSPYGQGEPQRLAPLQEMLDKLYTLLRDHARYFAHPQKVAPQAVVERMQDELGRLWARANEVISIPQDLYENANEDIRKIITALDPPQLQPAMIQLINLVREEMDVIGGTVEVMRGQAKSEWSGETVKSLQSAARGPIGAKARSAASMLQYIGKLWADAIIRYLPAREWSRRNRKYPVQVFDTMRNRLKRVGYDVVAQVSGSGTKEQKQQRLTAMIQNNPMLFQSPTFSKQFFEAFEVPQAERIANELQAIGQMAPTR